MQSKSRSLQSAVYEIHQDSLSDTASVEDAQKNTALYIAAFDDPAAGLESTDRFTRFISSLAMRATAVIGVEHRLYYRQEYVALARATAQEAVERQTAEVDKVMLTLQTYWLTRRYSVGTRSFFGYIRAVNGLKIPEQLWDDPTVQALGHAATDVTIITNDILSYKKELIEDGAPHNILTILMHDPSIACSDLQQAIDYASNLFDEALDRFNECRAELQDSPDLRRYADGIADYFVGKLEWEMSSPRYNVFESEEDRKNLVLKL
ncbi:isoprenoid synthase domain-containing protein [Scleroderma yunnanense]